jgi:hypothetical protein
MFYAALLWRLFLAALSAAVKNHEGNTIKGSGELVLMLN